MMSSLRPSLLLTALFCAACGTSSTTGDKSTDTESGTTTDSSGTTEDSDDSGTTNASTDWCQSLEAEGWSEATHAKGVDGDYETVFGQDSLPRLDIIICPDDYTAMRDDLETLLGGSGGGGGPGGGGPGGGGGGVETEEDPIYVPVTVAFDGQTWPYVGMRHKGNSSLTIAYREGIEKLPFRLHFDHYEDDVPEVDNQRFHGFKELKFSSGYEDDSLIRDKLTADLFREAGVPAAAGGMMAVYVDTGDGPVFWGVYAAFEDPAGELLDSWFGDDGGNAYKPDGETAALHAFDAEDFEKKTAEDEADWSDVEAFIAALNATDSDAETWRTHLEATFDVDGFLRYLALNNLVGNWDSYGNMTHNYYLYGDPALDGRLVWIPWDFNEAMRTNGKMPLVPIALDEVDADWPLIARVAEDPVYKARYLEHLADLTDTVFTEAAVQARAEALQAQIADAVAEEAAPYTHLSRYSDFTGALDASDGVVTRVTTARADAAAALAE